MTKEEIHIKRDTVTMHNGCLLLLAFVAVFQPIASYTERGLVNGRQERCDYRTSVRDPGLNFHGTYRFNKPAVEDRRLNQREDIRKLRRNEVKEETLRIASSSDRRLADNVDRARNSVTRDRIGNDAVLRRETRDTPPVSSHRDERKQEIRRGRISRLQETHEARFPSRRENSRLSVNENRSRRIDNRRFNERVSVESRRVNEYNAYSQMVRKQREVRVDTDRARDGARRLNERRISREAIEKMDSLRFVSRIPSREITSRRFRGEMRSSSTASDRVNHAYTNEALRLAREDRQTSNSQRIVNEQKQRDPRIRLVDERRNSRDHDSRSVRAFDPISISENRRTAQRVESAYRQREIRDTENEAGPARAARTRGDRENRVLVNRNDNRNVETGRRQIINAEKNVREFELKAKRTETCVHDRELSSDQRMARMMTRERLQETRRFTPNVRSQTDRTERLDEDRRSIAHNFGVSAFRTERSDESGRDARNIEVREIRNERAIRSQRDSRSFGIRSSRTERSETSTERNEESRREARTVGVRGERTERVEKYRRDARGIGARSFRSERTEQERRDARNIISQRGERNEDNRRHAGNSDLRAFRTERTDERRSDARIVGARLFRSERTDERRSDARIAGARLFRSERTVESRQDAREFGIRAFRSERADESRRNARSVDIQADGRINGMSALRTERADSRQQRRNIEDIRAFESATYRRDTQGLRQSRSLDRVTESRRDRRNTDRDARVQERTLESRRMVRNRASRAEDERVNNRRATRSVEREIRSMGRERSMESRLNRDSRMSTPDRRSEETRREPTRAIERLDKLDALDSRRITLQRDSRRDTQKTDRDSLSKSIRQRHIEAESRTNFDTEFARKREVQAMFRSAKIENEPTMMNWQYLFYTLQGLYICGLLIQLNKGNVEKKARVSWWPAPQHLIKVD